MGTCGELLTQLDRGGANRLKGFGIARLLGHACSETGETRQTADRQWRQRVLLYAGERAMTSENATPFEETPEIGGRASGWRKFFMGCSPATIAAWRKSISRPNMCPRIMTWPNSRPPCARWASLCAASR